MSPETKAMIDRITAKLEVIDREAARLKRLANELAAFENASPVFADDAIQPITGTTRIEHDTFFGMGVSTAVKLFLRMKGKAAPAADILDALRQGGFEFPEMWKPEH